MCLYIIHFLLAVNYDKKVVQTHFLLLFVNKKYPETYILLWKGGWFWLFTHFANKKPSASPRAFYCCKMCKKSKSPPFLYYKKAATESLQKTTPKYQFILKMQLLHLGFIHMFCQIIWPKGCILNICFAFIHCVFSNAFLKCLPDGMHSYIGCICLIFVHRGFSNASSNCPQNRMHSHIGCIYLTSLHCVFSNVPSNCLPGSMHSHIGCICLTFLHCEFSNVSLNCLPEKRHGHIGCICLTFLHCVP